MNYAIALTAGLVLLASSVDGQSVDDPQAKPPVHREAPDDPYLPRPGVVRDAPLPPQLPLASGLSLHVQVNVDALGNNIPGDAANEPSIAVDPTAPNRITIGWRQFDSVKSNFRQAGWGYSHDGGRTWTFPGVLEPGVFRSDPVLDVDADGNFYYYSLTGNFLCDMYISTDAGVSWIGPTPAWGGDKAWMAIDRTGGIGQGNIYCAWSVFAGCCGDDTFIRSTDGGMTFTTPSFIPLAPIFGSLVVGPGGELYVSGVAPFNFGIFLVAKSTSAQDPAAPPIFELTTAIDLGGSMVLGAGPNPAGLLGQAWVAVDHSSGPTRGHVYLLGSVNPPGPDPLDVMFARSTDGGLTWSAPIRVNDDPTNNGAWQWFGTMSVAPTGRIDVVFNDTRNSGAVNISELFYSFSTDGGKTWSTNVALSPPFDSHIGWPNQNKLGDYYHMVSDRVGANLAYAATFNGEQDVYFLRIGGYDCNDNGIADSDDIADQTSGDCNDNAIPDECEIAAGTLADRDRNGIPDECEPVKCSADLDADGIVGILDLLALLAAWGPNPDHPADFNGDGAVGILDLLELLANWGPCI
ncbi:MAG: sialidase family protein [Planctomycetota bacterium]|nr:sialidase family protein [Planctomycetota bacterium]